MIAGVGAGAPRPLAELAQDRPGELVFAEALSGDRFALDDAGRVLRYDPGADERALAGSTFERWLDATVAREQILFGPDGEYAPDVFDPAAQEIVPTIALRQAERALKVDPGAADAEHARGLALARLGRRETALAAFGAATELDAGQPLAVVRSRAHGAGAGQPAVALPAFRRAAAAASEDADGGTPARVGGSRRRRGRRRGVGDGAARGSARARSAAGRRPAARAPRRRRRRGRRSARRGAGAAGGGRARHPAPAAPAGRSTLSAGPHPNALPVAGTEGTGRLLDGGFADGHELAGVVLAAQDGGQPARPGGDR